MSVVLFVIAGFCVSVSVLLLSAIGSRSVPLSYEAPAAVVALIGLALGGLCIAAGVQVLALKRTGKALGMWAAGVFALWSLAMLFGGDNPIGLVGLLLCLFVVANLQKYDRSLH